MKIRIEIPLLFALALVAASTPAQEHQHHNGDEKKPVMRPKIFLDKSPRIIQYQLNRLDNERLLLVERSIKDKKYAPVYTAILTRAGMSPQYREEALKGLVAINKSDAAAELLKSLETVGADDRQSQRTARQLAAMLLRQPAEVLKTKSDDLATATKAESSLLRSIGHAGLIMADRQDVAWSRAQTDESAMFDWLAAVSFVPKPAVRSALREQIVELTDKSQPVKIRSAAIAAIRFVPSQQDATFRLLAPLVSDQKLRTAAVRTLLTIPAKQRDPERSRELVGVLVKHAEATPAAERTTDDFIDAMQLADQLFARIPADAARAYRERLRAITVRVVRIRTVNEEMRYDTPFFAVEAGRPVQVILQNEDLMPHNLVITVPEALKEVAQLGLAAGPDGGFQGKQYVPKSENVLQATHIVQPGQQQRITFTAPSKPGEYPFVCTFPRHWMRMYGVMVVVEDLDVWLKNPVEPKDPVGSNRPFVKKWTVDELKGELTAGLRGRSAEIGHRIFVEASCAQCHKLKAGDKGGNVGPELTDVFKRLKGDRTALLREVLEPSHRIDPKYAVRLIITLDGKTVTGIVQAENKTSVSVLVDPEAKKPTIVERANIDEMVQTSTSMMPKALLDRFTKDEIFELIAYLENLAPASE